MKSAPQLLASCLAGIFPRIQVLIETFVPNIPALIPRGHKIHPAGIDQLTFHVRHKGFQIDVFVTEIAYGTNNYRRAIAGASGEIRNPGAGQHVLNHLLGHQTRIAVIPGPAKIDGGIGGYPLNSGTAGAKQQGSANNDPMFHCPVPST
jgi:hypothetical protein